MLVRLKNSSDELRVAKIGFSWTVFFFGFLVPICRGDAKWAIIMFVLALCTCWIAMIVLGFMYNGIYIRGLLSQGFYPADDLSRQDLVRAGFIAG